MIFILKIDVLSGAAGNVEQLDYWHQTPAAYSAVHYSAYGFGTLQGACLSDCVCVHACMCVSVYCISVY